jgi:hypothetical protein
MACTHAVVMAVLSRAGGAYGGGRHHGSGQRSAVEGVCNPGRGDAPSPHGGTQVIRVEMIEVAETYKRSLATSTCSGENPEVANIAFGSLRTSCETGLSQDRSKVTRVASNATFVAPKATTEAPGGFDPMVSHAHK